MDSPFLARVARELGRSGARVVRFEFPYMAGRRTGGGRKAPDREPVLRRTWLEVISRFRSGSKLVIGGKSMGGRIASLVADEAGVSGLLCLGYPFHPPGQPQRLRTVHLDNLRTPTLIVQGTRDAFGSRKEVQEYPLAPGVRIHWIEQGDHSWKPPARSGRTEAQNLDDAIQAIRDFLANPEVVGSRNSDRGARN